MPLNFVPGPELEQRFGPPALEPGKGSRTEGWKEGVLVTQAGSGSAMSPAFVQVGPAGDSERRMQEAVG